VGIILSKKESIVGKGVVELLKGVNGSGGLISGSTLPLLRKERAFTIPFPPERISLVKGHFYKKKTSKYGRKYGENLRGKKTTHSRL